MFEWIRRWGPRRRRSTDDGDRERRREEARERDARRDHLATSQEIRNGFFGNEKGFG